MDGNKGFHGMRVLYLPFLLDQYPLVCASCWCRVYPSGFDSNDSYTFPKICPITFWILTNWIPEGNATNIIFGSITLCSVSALFPALLVLVFLELHWRSYLFALCFSPAGSRFSDTLYQNFCKPLWDVISYMVSNVPMPTPGKDLVLFAIENCLLSVEALLKDGLPHVENIEMDILERLMEHPSSKYGSTVSTNCDNLNKFISVTGELFCKSPIHVISWTVFPTPKGLSWVQSMFSGDPSRAKAFGRARKGTSDGTSGFFFHSSGHPYYNNFVNLISPFFHFLL
ncbi:hypothetical protein SADUNF_Sadunf15G0044700 [Salix dunnii]|uniref:Uncharacterized protein n=1 Tax=Salix dunnii TaxID=1413687 RepID=A0A835MKX9_9ROSI|nr:hypothetical protein SADUNF_Sadunf15G0044700 [Salix dunnii]